MSFLPKDIVKTNHNTRSSFLPKPNVQGSGTLCIIWGTEMKFVHYQTTKFKNCVVTRVASVLHTPLGSLEHQQGHTERYDLLTHKDEEPCTLRPVVHAVQ